MTSIWATPADEAPAPPAPPSAPSLLREPLLYISGLTEAVPDAVLVEAFSEVLRVRPMIQRLHGSQYAEATGHIEFETLEKAEKAYAISAGVLFPDYNSTLDLHINPLPSEDPEPQATPRLLKSLPHSITSGQLYDLCRPYGPIHRVALQFSPAYPPGSGPASFKGQAVVAFYKEEHAQRAANELHCLEMEGKTIIVQTCEASRAGPRRSDPKSQSAWASLPTFVPSGSPTSIGQGYPSPSALNATVPSWTPQSRNFSSTSQTSMHDHPPPLSPTGSYYASSVLPSHTQSQSQSQSQTYDGPAAIDPCNLFVKSIDPTLASQDLFNLFSPYGKILSSRIMRDERTGTSKEFGFVSFAREEEAEMARKGMDGVRVGTKNIVVRVHEPKGIREKRMVRRGRGSDLVEDEYEDVLSNKVANMSTHNSSYSRELSPDTFSNSSNQMSREPSDEPSSAAPLSEHERLLTAISRLEPVRASDVLALIEGLPKKERAMCLFYNEYLKSKVADALLVLSSSNDEDAPVAAAPAKSPPSPAATPKPKPKNIPTTLPALASLPASEIMALINGGWTESIGIEKVGEVKSSATDEFMDTLEGKATHEAKQKLGDRLFKAIKVFGVKGAPRITIALLDTEDLRPLAHLIDYPTILKEKVLPLVTAK